MMPSQQRLKAGQVLRAGKGHLEFVQHDLFVGLRQANRFRHARRMEKFLNPVQPKVKNHLSTACFCFILSQPWLD